MPPNHSTFRSSPSSDAVHCTWHGALRIHCIFTVLLSDHVLWLVVCGGGRGTVDIVLLAARREPTGALRNVCSSAGLRCRGCLFVGITSRSAREKFPLALSTCDPTSSASFLMLCASHLALPLLCAHHSDPLLMCQSQVLRAMHSLVDRNGPNSAVLYLHTRTELEEMGCPLPPVACVIGRAWKLVGWASRC